MYTQKMLSEPHCLSWQDTTAFWGSCDYMDHSSRTQSGKANPSKRHLKKNTVQVIWQVMVRSMANSPELWSTRLVCNWCWSQPGKCCWVALQDTGIVLGMVQIPQESGVLLLRSKSFSVTKCSSIHCQATETGFKFTHDRLDYLSDAFISTGKWN